MTFALGKRFFDEEIRRGMAVFIQATKSKLSYDIWKYMNRVFKPTFIKHGQTETEINIVDNNIDDEGWKKLETLKNEAAKLDFKGNIHRLLKPWILKFEGQPQNEENRTLGRDIEARVLMLALKFLETIQKFLISEKRAKENAECEQKCLEGSKVVNLTQYSIDPAILEHLRKGLGSVPRTKEQRKLTIERITSEIKISALKYFFKINGFRPPKEIMKLDFQGFIKQILIFSPACEKENKFFYALKDQFKMALRTVDDFTDKSAKLDDMTIFETLPSDVIISCADKNIATVILPINWYIEEYGRQQVKGGYETINISEEKCIANLNYTIGKFREYCSAEQKRMLSEVWPKSSPKQRIGVLKLTPKLHKLKGVIGPNSWKELTGRPIRGAELCPTNAPSIALCKLLQNLLHDLKCNYKKLAPGSVLSELEFPILKGCDSYSKMAQNINLLSENFSSTFILSADFSDAYTLSLRGRLQESISILGQALDYTHEHIALMIGLVNLVFDNVFFYTIFGLQRSTKGFPMGGHASRDALDVDLVRSEMEILACLVLDTSRIHIYGRMVDDVSCILQGSFDDMTKLLIKMATIYPNMPLNVQISQVFGRFLDMSIYNFLNTNDKEYKLTTTLTWKSLNTYSYIGEDENKFSGYKGAVVPTTLARIYRRCSSHDERMHHDRFIFKILKNRGQSVKRLDLKRKQFFRKKSNIVKKSAWGSNLTFPVMFDDVSNSHSVSKNIIERAANFNFKMAHKSKHSVGSKLCPKRKVLERVKQFYDLTHCD